MAKDLKDQFFTREQICNSLQVYRFDDQNRGLGGLLNKGQVFGSYLFFHIVEANYLRELQVEGGKGGERIAARRCRPELPALERT